VAYEIAVRLHVAMMVFVVRKLGMPGHEEFAMGALASGGTCFLNEAVVQQLGLRSVDVERVMARERAELERREEEYGGLQREVNLRHRTVILVDDGLATGSTMLAAVAAVRQQSPEKVIVAIPVAPHDVWLEFQSLADEVVCELTPTHFSAVGEWYEDFSQTSDTDVRELLQHAEANLNRRVRSTPPVL